MSVTRGIAQELDFLYDEEEDKKIIINEYERIKKLSDQPISYLYLSGFTNEEIDFINNPQEGYANHIREVIENTGLDHELLSESYGYTDEQIEILENFEGTEDEIVRVAATLQIGGIVNDYIRTTNNGQTVTRQRYSWGWQGEPNFKMRDVLGIGYNNWELTGQTNTVRYVDRVGTQADFFLYPTTTVARNGYAARVDITMAQRDNRFYARSGAGAIHLTSAVHAPTNLLGDIVYGHQIIGFTPTLVIGNPPLSVSISPRTLQEDHRVLNFSCCRN